MDTAERGLRTPTRLCETKGHGPVFSDTLYAIQTRCISELGLRRIDCGICDGVYCEMGFAGFKPSEDQIQRWQLDPVAMGRMDTRWARYLRHEVTDPQRKEKEKMLRWLTDYNLAQADKKKGWLGKVTDAFK